MPENKKLPSGGRFIFYRQEFLKSMDGKVETAMKQTVVAVANRVRLLQTGARTGRVYRIGKSPTKADKLAGRSFRGHTASAPGEPPAVWSGRLFRSVFERIQPWFHKGQHVWYGAVGTNVDYAPVLEFGDKKGKLKPRPLWRRAVLETRQQIKEFWSKVKPETPGKPGKPG